MRARNTGLLQTLPQALARVDATTTLGTYGSSEGGVASQERGRAGTIAGASTESRVSGTHYTRCGTDTNRERKCNGAGYRPCTQGRDRSGYWASQVVVKNPPAESCACPCQPTPWNRLKGPDDATSRYVTRVHTAEIIEAMVVKPQSAMSVEAWEIETGLHYARLRSTLTRDSSPKRTVDCTQDECGDVHVTRMRVRSSLYVLSTRGGNRRERGAHLAVERRVLSRYYCR